MLERANTVRNFIQSTIAFFSFETVNNIKNCFGIFNLLIIQHEVMDAQIFFLEMM
jgi:hypothetical protein